MTNVIMKCTCFSVNYTSVAGNKEEQCFLQNSRVCKNVQLPLKASKIDKEKEHSHAFQKRNNILYQ